jgi:hypothetical protein
VIKVNFFGFGFVTALQYIVNPQVLKDLFVITWIVGGFFFMWMIVLLTWQCGADFLQEGTKVIQLGIQYQRE